MIKTSPYLPKGTSKLSLHKLLFILLLVLVTTGQNSIFAQTEDGGYTISSITFDIKGRTKEAALLRITEIKTGTTFKKKDDLEKYIAEKTTILRNQRILEFAEITYTALENGVSGENTNTDIELKIQTRDSHNFIIFPEPKYSSTNGWRTSIRARDYNVLGSGSPLRFNFEYSFGDKNEFAKDNFNIVLTTDIPFTALGFNWNFKFDTALQIFGIQDDFEGMSFQNTTGLSVDIPLSVTVFTIGYDQGVNVHPEYDSWKKYITHTNIENLWFLSSTGFLAWRTPLFYQNEKLGKLMYFADVRSGANYSAKDIDLDSYAGAKVDLSQHIGFNKINWVNNFREGFNINVANANIYNSATNRWQFNISENAEAHFLLSTFAGLSLRLHGLQWLNGAETEDDIWDRSSSYLLRGIKDDLLSADHIITLNLDISFLVFKFMPSKWFNSKKAGYFDFDFHLGPLFDLGIASGQRMDKKLKTEASISFKPEDWLLSAGFEVIVFPLAFRSMFLRGSIGWNVSKWSKNYFGEYEIDIGLGHFY
ncbi:MAG: hypothetical protein Ta2G_05270 [Termitinemataceae bacterium]|nr:MAG: hypothetical protein Ta2G_05270 [Termitinemataceae bacterium]